MPDLPEREPRRQVPLAIIGTLAGVIVGALIAWLLLSPPRPSLAVGSASPTPRPGSERSAATTPKFTSGPVSTAKRSDTAAPAANRPPAFTSAVAPEIVTPVPRQESVGAVAVVTSAPEARVPEDDGGHTPPDMRHIAGNPPQKIDVKSLRTTVDDVVIPVPSEVFKALDKLGTPPWASQVRVDEKTRHSGRPHLSLLFGTVVADGFLAVQAKDADKVKKIGRRVLELATAMGVRANVISHTQSIIEAADRGDWNEVRSELDKTQGEVKSAMEKLQDREESELVSIGGWLRGTEALTEIINADYQPERAELLHQAVLLETFDKQINLMRSHIRRDALVVRLAALVLELRPMIAGNGRISPSHVMRINQLTSGLVATISPPAPAAISDARSSIPAGARP